MSKNLLVKLMALVLFFVLFCLGIRLSQNKMLWNDELYSQVHGIEKLSYAAILQGKIPEGNNSPLFYILQKGLCDVTGYRLPLTWRGEWGIAEPKAQVILRLFSNLFMSLALAAVFYFFAADYSLFAGIYALLIAITTEICWGYWAEARPYALWFCLSAFQALYFLRIVLGQSDQNKNWRNLTITHILLSSTVVFGAVQAFIAAMLLYLFYKRELSKYVLLFFLPLLIGVFYFLHAPHYIFGLPPDSMPLITDNVPVDRFLLIYLCGLIMLGYCLWQRQFQQGFVMGRYGIFAILLFLAAAGIMKYFALSDPGLKPFIVSSRYFIFLAPAGVVTAAVFSLELLKLFRGNLWMTVNVIIICAGFLAIRVFRIMQEIFSGLGIC